MVVCDRMPLTNLQKVRRSRLMTQQQLADEAGVSKFTITRLERGGEPSLATVERLAKALNTTPDELGFKP